MQGLLTILLLKDENFLKAFIQNYTDNEHEIKVLLQAMIERMRELKRATLENILFKQFIGTEPAKQLVENFILSLNSFKTFGNHFLNEIINPSFLVKNNFAGLLKSAISLLQQEAQRITLVDLIKNGNLDTLKNLTSHGLVIKAYNIDKYNGLSLVHLAVLHDQGAILNYLIELGLDYHLSAREDDENHCTTPLCLACREGNLPLVKPLINWGANDKA
jgi:ankyrin repeat protein